MQRTMKIGASCVLLLGTMITASCAPAPLYTASKLKKGAATSGEIPRDARGEPLWSAIRPIPVREVETPPFQLGTP